MLGGAIVYRSKTQSLTALSSTEAEFGNHADIIAADMNIVILVIPIVVVQKGHYRSVTLVHIFVFLSSSTVRGSVKISDRIDGSFTGKDQGVVPLAPGFPDGVRRVHSTQVGVHGTQDLGLGAVASCNASFLYIPVHILQEDCGLVSGKPRWASDANRERL